MSNSDIETYSSPAIGNGCLYLEVRKMQGNSMIDKMRAVLKKDNGYSIDSAEIFDLEERDYIWTNSHKDGTFCEAHLGGSTYINGVNIGATKEWCIEVGSDTEYKTVEPETTSEAVTDTKSEGESGQASENKAATGAGVVLFVRKRKDGEIQQKKLI